MEVGDDRSISEALSFSDEQLDRRDMDPPEPCTEPALNVAIGCGAGERSANSAEFAFARSPPDTRSPPTTPSSSDIMGEPEIESEVSMEELHEKSATLNGGLTSPASAAASATPARGNRSARVSVPVAFPSEPWPPPWLLEAPE